MKITSEQLLMLHKCIAQGPIDKASIVIFGNEFGTARGGGDTERTINAFLNEYYNKKLLKIGEGYSTLEIEPPPVSSVFLQFISRLMLALKYKDDRFFGELSSEGITFINNYIMNELYRTNSAIINLKPLPQRTERHWDYSNINEAEYNKLYNFTLLNQTNEPYKSLRLRAIRTAFSMIKEGIVLGSGDKENKKAFIQTLYPEIKFTQFVLSPYNKIYFAQSPKIILSNYFDNRNGIKLSGLKQIYEFINYHKLLP